MAIGTAGYTAMLCVLALERHGVTPASGPVLVTGAAGGVGSVAVALLARLGYQVIASTGRMSEAEYLKGLGASEMIDRASWRRRVRSARSAGRAPWMRSAATRSRMLCRMTKYGGTVAACGLAQGMDLPASVAPFILRGVTLAGVDSVMAPKAARVEAWARLARDLDREARGHDGDAPRRRRAGACAGDPGGQGARARGAGAGVGWVSRTESLCHRSRPPGISDLTGSFKREAAWANLNRATAQGASRAIWMGLQA